MSEKGAELKGSEALLTKSQPQQSVSPLRCCWSIRLMLLVFPLLVVSSIIFIGILVWYEKKLLLFFFFLGC